MALPNGVRSAWWALRIGEREGDTIKVASVAID
jgi:hypothetical protein